MSGSQEQGLSIYRLRLVGYGLLLFALIDTLLVFYPPQFTNAAWELQTMGAVVERLPVPLLGLVMVFFGEDYERNALENIFLKIVYWFSLFQGSSLIKELLYWRRLYTRFYPSRLSNPP